MIYEEICYIVSKIRPDFKGKNLFDTVIYLENNGFEFLAYTLDESELARKAKDKKFQADFKSAAAKQ